MGKYLELTDEQAKEIASSMDLFDKMPKIMQQQVLTGIHTLVLKLQEQGFTITPPIPEGK